MHRLIAEQAGHGAIADAMSYVDHTEVQLERLEAERAAERKRENRDAQGPRRSAGRPDPQAS